MKVVAVVSEELFDEQPEEYKKKVLSDADRYIFFSSLRILFLCCLSAAGTLTLNFYLFSLVVYTC